MDRRHLNPALPTSGSLCYNHPAVESTYRIRALLVSTPIPMSGSGRRASHEFLPGLFSAAGIETLQAGVQDVRLLPVLLGLLLMPRAAAALLLM